MPDLTPSTPPTPVPAEQLVKAIKADPTTQIAPGSPIHMVDHLGNPVTIDSSQLPRAIFQGLQLDTPVQQAVRAYAATKDNIGGSIEQFAKSAVNNLALGIPAAIEERNETPLERMEEEAVSAEHPIAEGLGTVAGLAGNIALTGGVVGEAGDAVAKASGIAGLTDQVAAASAQAASKLGLPTKATQMVADVLQKGISGAGEGLTDAIKTGVAGSLYSAPHALTVGILDKDPAEAAEEILAGAALGSAAGGANVLLAHSLGIPHLMGAMAGFGPVKTILNAAGEVQDFLPEKLEDMLGGFQKMASKVDDAVASSGDVLDQMTKGFGGTNTIKGRMAAALLGVLKESDDPTEQIEQLGSLLSDVGTSPELQSNNLNTLAQYLPGPLSAAMTGKVIDTQNYLHSILPKTQTADNPLSNTKQTLSNTQLDKFDRQAAIINNPLSILDRLQRGTLTTDEMETMQRVYPGVLNQLRTGIMGKLADGQYKIPYQQRLKLGLFMGGSAEPSLSPSSINWLQGTFLASPTFRNSIPSGGASKLDLAHQAETPVQAHDDQDTD